ncbi:hypothetical protein BC833DRAFT_600016 [Globomyces pollinis-pini]|nr:hypothetical protein BC833DRAFT_600016 [Globomyces pollinis-pini]
MVVDENVGYSVEETLSSWYTQVELFAKRSLKNQQLREEYIESVKEMSDELLQDLKKNPNNAPDIAKSAIEMRNQFMDRTRSQLNPEELIFSKALKEEGLTIEKLMKKELDRNFQSRNFEDLSSDEQLTFYENVVTSSGRTSSTVDQLAKWMGRAGRVVLILSLLVVPTGDPVSHSAFQTLMNGRIGATIGWAINFNLKSSTQKITLQPPPKDIKGEFRLIRTHYYRKKKRTVSISLREGMIEVYRLDHNNKPDKIYFSTSLASGVDLDKRKDRNHDYHWILIGIEKADGERTVYWFRPLDEKLDYQFWFRELERHQKWSLSKQTNV